MDLRNRWVNFRIRDVYIPDPQDVLNQLYGDDLLQGKVVDVSDAGTGESTFVVVEVEGLQQPVIVPVPRILGVL